MAPAEDKELEDGLVEVGSQLASAPSDVDELISLLDADESELSERTVSDELPEVVANSPKSSRNTKTVDQSYLEDSIKTPSRRKRPRGTEEISETPDHETKLDQSLVGSKIQVWWPGDKRFYNGIVDSFDPNTGEHKIVYDDDDIEILHLKNEKYKIVEDGGEANKGKDVQEVDMSGKEKGKKLSGPAPVKLLDGIPVGELRDCLVEDITTHVTHCDHFSPCISWPEHKKANRVNDLWDTLKYPWGLPECENTKKWFNNTARSRWSDFKTRKLKPFFDSAYPDLGKAIANRPENFIDAITWEKLCKQFVVISDSGMDPDGKSKSQKCTKSRQANKMNHSLGRTALDKWKDQHNETFGKLPNVAQVFDKAYLRIDPLQQLRPSTSAADKGEGSQLQLGITLYPEAHRVSEDLHKYYDEAINTGSDESTANTNSVLKVFGRTTRLGLESSRSSKQRSKRPYSSNHKEINALREQIAAEKKKREDLEHAFGSLLDYLRQQGLLPPDDHNESNEEKHQD